MQNANIVYTFAKRLGRVAKRLYYGQCPDTSRFFILHMVYFCYVDESGTPHIPGNTSHYVLCGVSVPVKYWKEVDKAIHQIKCKYGIADAEIHTGWIMRAYIEQSKIVDFGKLSYDERRSEVLKYRKSEIFRLQKSKSLALKQVQKNYKHTEPYIHLTYEERINFLEEIADYIGRRSYIRIFAECVDKVFFDPRKSKLSIDEQALEQLVSRFEQYMCKISTNDDTSYGLLIHDNNPTVSKTHTELMNRFHRKGTFWTSIKHIIETPLFVDSQLTGMVQIADLCALALRRYFENNETLLLDKIKSRFDSHRGVVVGVRHFAASECTCDICILHRK